MTNDCKSCSTSALCGVHRTVGTPYASSVAARLQDTVDAGRMLHHEMGLRPYKVYLVWQKRSPAQRFEEIKRIQLLPVKYQLSSEFTRISWKLDIGGGRPEGEVQLSEISPNQVTEGELRGQLDGKDPPPDVEFFYEVVLEPRCPGHTNQIWRYTINSVPTFVPDKFSFVLDLVDQAVPRAAEDKEDRDQVHTPGKQGGFRVRL